MLLELMNFLKTCFGQRSDRYVHNVSDSRGHQEGLLWYKDTGQHAFGEFSMAVVQANNLLEDQSQVESGTLSLYGSSPFGTFVGIYDGHGGPETSCYINNNLFQHLKRFAGEQQSMSVEVIKKAFQATEDGFFSLVAKQWPVNPQIAAVGSCCLVGIVCNGILYVANAGDSRAVMGRVVKATGEVLAVQLSEEHNASIESVRQELRSLHPDDPQVVWKKHNVWRVKGIIQISRSIGDIYLKKTEFNKEPLYSKFRVREPFSKPFLSSEPAVTVVKLQPEDRASPRLCSICNERRPALKRPKTLEQICRECFYEVFEEEIHQVIVDNKLFKPGERLAIGASGGKDSTVLAYVMSTLNRRHNYGLDLFLLSVDEGITGYRDDSLETVKRNQIQYGLPLKVVSYKDLYGWTMDEIVKMIGLKNNCTFCGVFRRQALDRGAAMLKVDKVVTGHNADDIAETVLLNILRGDIARLSRCTYITTGEDGPIPRCKPFKYTYEKEIVMYAYFKKLDYFSTECIYSPNAYRGFAREFIKDLERLRPRAILDIIKSGEDFRISTTTKMPEQGTCERCGYISSQKWCKACVLLEGLNRGLPKLGIGRTKGLNSAEHEKANTKHSNGTSSIESKQLDF